MKRLWPVLLAFALFLVLVLGVLFRSYGARIPGASRMCEPGLGVAGGASCQLAVSTRDRVREETSGAKDFAVKAYDPLTRTDLAFSCARGEVVRCEGPGGQVVVVEP